MNQYLNIVPGTIQHETTTTSPIATTTKTRNPTMTSPLIISAIKHGVTMDGAIKDLLNIETKYKSCKSRKQLFANEESAKVPIAAALLQENKENNKLYQRLKPRQKEKLDIFFKADPELLKYYNQTEIKYPDPRKFDELNQQKINQRVEELKRDKKFQEKKEEIKKINSQNKYKPENEMVKPLVKIFTSKLDGSWKIVAHIKELNQTIENMVDSGSPICLCSGAMARKHQSFTKKRPTGFPAKSVVGDKVFQLQKYLQLTIVDHVLFCEI